MKDKIKKDEVAGDTTPPTPPTEIKQPFGEEEKPKPTESSSPDLIKDLKEQLDEQKKTIDMLIQVADKTQLSRFYTKNQKKLPKVVKLSVMNVGEEQKVIMAWRMTKNQVYKDPLTQRWQEIQEVELAFEDGTSQKYPYMTYVNATMGYTQIEARVISSTTDEETGNLILKVARLDNGKEYLIDVRFVN